MGSLLLCNLPFAPPTPPHLALPVLAAYLRGRGKSVLCWDGNNAFIHRAARRERIDAGRRLLDVLSRRPQAPSWLGDTARLVDRLGDSLYGLASPEVFRSPQERNLALEAVLALASLGKDERVLFDHGSNSLGVLSTRSPYASKDSIEAAAERKGLLEGFFEEELLPLVDEKVILVGLSVSFAEQFGPALRAASVVREAAPRKPLYLGGSFASYHLRDLADDALFDLVDGIVVGDGESALEELMDREEGGREPEGAVAGLLTRGRRSVPAASGPPLSALPDPDFSDFPPRRYFFPRGRAVLPLRFSRGCWWNRCSFCRGYDGAYDRAEASFLRDQLLRLADRTESESFILSDACLLPDVLYDFARLLLEGDGRFHWNAHFRFHPSLTMEKILLLREAGCSRLFMGLESFSDRILTLMDKGITTELIDRNLQDLAWVGMDVFLYVIVGFPSETEEEARQGFARLRGHLSRGLSAAVQFNPFILFPDSPVGKDPGRYGLFDVVYDDREDLIAPARSYRGSGMTAERAAELAREFSRSLRP
ncbi:radical SAM protein [Aminithiophilus ramosus]|uniref:Radical SAM protein n=1 Tax=Aminithiophilus ramosus TaxID=3029084 RepID=A0A9Q7EWJ6_9BACT|nr:radical SAM protein [Aminithiophilus ramosus]QTX33323.1 radical SAM protein [Aminithiophilus ramosus]